MTPGWNPIPPYKHEASYRFESDRFGRAELTPVASETVSPPRAAECPVAMEAVVEAEHPVAEDDEAQRGGIVAVEVRISSCTCTRRSAWREPPTASTRTRGDR
ncbi:hypothetical protein [Saccharopolyspora sp. ASAGF58]|uniref:hypothetical protein n=1 Tax=Saccharopolyspora sp. ASAGF58 TaxID=2719023 RepID=UPI001FF0B3D4|nr:hypothetical protein [Saccharopolyspora sp. ASAGF58]